jgi:hypothetical protein
MKSLTLVADDRVGLLMDIATILAQAKINIETVNADAHAGKAIVIMTLSDAEKGKKVLETAGYKIESTGALVIELDDKPGELGRITALLSKEGISIRSVHTIAKDGKKTVLSLRASDQKKAAALLKECLISSSAD